MSDLTPSDYYWSVHGGWVHRECGAIVQEPDTHDEWHSELMAWLNTALETT